MTDSFEQFIQTHLHDDVNELALHAGKYPDIDVRQAVVQIRGRQIAEKKLPLWYATDGIVYPEHLPLEQCSSQLTAEYKASLIKSLPEKAKIADFTGGFGVDLTILGHHFQEVTYIEQNPALCQIAETNLPLLGLNNIHIVCGQCEQLIANLPHQNLIFIDPARRDANGRKTVLISDCLPDVTSLNDLLLEKSDWCMIKLSPMLDVSATIRQLHGVREIHIVSVDGECKEVVAIISKETTDEVRITCANLTSRCQQTFTFTNSGEAKAISKIAEADKIGQSEMPQYLYEPNASLMKASCFKSISQHYGIDKLHSNSHLYVSADFIEDFPGRTFEIEQVFQMNKHELKTISQLKKANLTVRNFPSTVAELRKKLHLAEGGNHYLFATTLADERKVLILCK
ncbi:MAG: SAM-dependent methyltransferase [Bacteroidaceae bacterium]|nr:SAM-dependent methyltransferase [Bacteroidaceae bacterium]